MAKKPSEAAAEALKDAVRRSMVASRAQVTAGQNEVSDLYTGNTTITRHKPDYAALPQEGLPFGSPHPTKTVYLNKGSRIAANLFTSRLRQILVQITPLGIPSWRPEALVGEAVGLVEDQQTILDTLAIVSGLEYTMERVAFLLPTQSYFGVRMRARDGEGPIAGSVEAWEAIEAAFCGYEPFLERFSWHTYQQQVGDAPDHIRKYANDTLERHPWEYITVTEVFHPGFDLGIDYPDAPAVPRSWFVSAERELYPRKRKTPELGELILTDSVPSQELYIDRALDPAPGEAFAPSEVSGWVPVYKSIIRVLDQIVHEVETTNRVTLYDKDAIKDTKIQEILDSDAGDDLYIGVDTANQTGENARGVNATMRPVERNTALSEYIATLNLLLSIFDDVTGVGPLDRGTAVNPEKSATEAAGLFQAAGDRRRDRLRVMARVISAMGEMYMLRQRRLLGTTTDIPISDTQAATVRVPDPAAALMAIRLNASALENASRSDTLEALMTMHTVLANDAASFQSPSAMRMLDESRRRLLKKMGWKDIDMYLDIMPDTRDPLNRYIRALHTGEAISVMESDNHPVYIQTYTDISTQPKADLVILQDAILRHQRIAQQQQAQRTPADPQAPIPGVSAAGGIDNNIQPDLALGNIPLPPPSAING